MPISIDRGLYETYAGKLEAEVEAFQAALEAHRFTEGVPAPMAADALIETIARAGGFVIVEPEQVVPPEPLTLAITALQLRLWLFNKGITGAAVDAKIATLGSPEKELAGIRWEYGTLFTRADPLVGMLGLALGFSPEQMDEGWVEALKL
jgi:hypothetical protein